MNALSPSIQSGSTTAPVPLAGGDGLMLQLLTDIADLTTDESAQLVRWWETARNGNERLTVFLARWQLVERALVRELDLIAKGYIALTDPGRYFPHDAAARLRTQLDELAPTDTPLLVAPVETVTTPAPLPTPEGLLGQHLAGYRLDRLLHAGQRAWTYLADDDANQRRIVLKVCPLTNAPRNPLAVERFVTDAQQPALLNHPGFVAPIAVIREHGWVLVALPRLAGSLAEQVATLAVVDAVRRVRQVAEVLALVHTAGCVHGNLKPSNILLAADHSVLLSDFCHPAPLGAAELIGPADTVADVQRLAELLTGLCAPPAQLGTATRALVERLRSGTVATARTAAQLLQQLETEMHTTDQVAIAAAEIPTNMASSTRLRGTLSSSGTKLTEQGLQAGAMLGKYLLTERVGCGSCGVVFRALHQTLGIAVAVKVLQVGSNLANIGEQLRTEARLLAQLNHPNIVRVWDFEEVDPFPYMVLEYVEGLSLAELINQSGRLRLDRALKITMQVTDGLTVAHKLGIVHRDIKPGNVLLTKDGTAKLADLGLALLTNQSTITGVSSPNEGVAGTVAYMAPEQALSSTNIDHRADLYALGATFYHALTGQLPFVGRSRMEVLLKHAREPLVPPHERCADIDPQISRIVLKLMAKKPDDRYPTYEALMADLAELKPIADLARTSVTDRVAHSTPPNGTASNGKRSSIWGTLMNLVRGKAKDEPT
jgi:serine/threonine protein kinase